MGIAGDHRNIIEYDFGGARAFGAWVELGVVINSIDPADTKLEITLNGMSRLNESLWSSNWNMMSLGRSWMDMGWFGGETGLVEEDMGSLPYVKCQPFKGYVTNAVIFQYPFSNTQMKQLYITSDVNECAIPSFPNCDGNAFCVNQPASFQCMCKPGYTGDGVTCTQLSLDAGQMGDVEGIKQAVGCGTDMPDCSRIGDRSAATCEKSVGELLPEMGGNNVKVKDMCKAMCNTCAEQLGGLDAVSAAGDIGV
uniref:EGF-like domain-containing protein n=1 Tax=Chromera velia CCMP2878 TaxID=1169474 RepID=A0A0G4F2I4_9ALVE|eukprot:Cvel_2687.t1-p1 / transcript=Cvel_2687.t1 / gene=Cvel_2687 / organism=Chromera_velia_CCMP2878 / gene_product=Fibrillin-1, putative / transcript_product=Fibrillin-1, putative / location=Cvel_scaffold107:102942-106294(-) / protein_length=251 / sequence_SO=supercontig / SO=protein_coding / is_pseudo=false